MNDGVTKENEGKSAYIVGNNIHDRFLNKEIILIDHKLRTFQLADENHGKQWFVSKKHGIKVIMNRNGANS